MVRCSGHRETGDGDRMASGGFSLVLALAIAAARRPTQGERRDADSHPPHGSAAFIIDIAGAKLRGWRGRYRSLWSPAAPRHKGWPHHSAALYRRVRRLQIIAIWSCRDSAAKKNHCHQTITKMLGYLNVRAASCWMNVPRSGFARRLTNEERVTAGIWRQLSDVTGRSRHLPGLNRPGMGK